MARSGISTYLKKAFVYHWNLLAFGGAAGFSLLSGRPDVFLPLTLAAEVTYLLALAGSARFQRHVDSLELQASRGQGDELLGAKAQKILVELSAPDKKRFEHLRGLCRDLLQISQSSPVETPVESLSGVREENINRLLWIFLKLLHSKSALDRFFATTREDEIVQQRADAERKLQALGQSSEGAGKQRAALEDIVETCKMRLENLRKARDNHEQVQIELERLYTKIAGVAEMGINRQDPRAVTHEIDVVSTSALETERAIHELDAITGFDVSDDAAPQLVARARAR